MKNNNITTIIVNYNSKKYLYNLMDSINIYSKLNEIIIIDNNSNIDNVPKINEIKKIYKKRGVVKILHNENNLGFAKAVNQGVRNAKSEYVLLLNPDTQLTDKKSIQILAKSLSKKNVSVVGGSIINDNNIKQKTATGNINFMTGLFEFTNLKKIFPKNKFSNRFWLKHKNITNNTTVKTLCGAFIMFKRKINNTLNLFDESFFLYLEDIDFCLKNSINKKKIVYCPKAIIFHHGGKSNSSKYNTELKYWYVSRKILFNKYLPKYQSVIINCIFNIEEQLLRLYHFLKNEPAY